ncbi:MAG: hypothetical protein RLZZ380_536 [Actinomycetota bacterium]|jgi:hypothetical protein
MHSNKLSRWLKLFFATLGITGLVGFAITAPSQAVSPNPTPYCSEGTCWVTFDYTGDNFVWTPPSKINSLHFDVLGAQGGRSGGKGGSVSGDFAAIPSSLVIYVGGMGASGNSAAGGFNGGGTSGNGHGDQGSGGGASDIRTSTNLSDRVVVAGGGGGTGGWIGGVGGPGGLTIAMAGAKGSLSGTAGGGGTQLAGGTAGLGVSVGNGNPGTLGIGGMGGSGSIAGGGGGGGGFYGGGGGGSDSISGGSDGAGGGGGSSFATMALTSSVAHQAGVRAGNGQVVLRYTFAPTATSFALTSSQNSTDGKATFQLAFDQVVYDLDPFDFKVSGTSAGCKIGNPIGDGYTFQIQVTECSSGTLNLSLRPQAVNGATAGPAAETLASGTVTFDSNAPEFTIVSPSSPSNAATLTYRITSPEPFTKPLASAFEVIGSGCQVGTIAMAGAATADVEVAGCQSSANVRLMLLANQVSDLAGNAGPAVSVASTDVAVDRDAPNVISNQQVAISADLIEYSVIFSEPVTRLSTESFSASPGCVVSKVDGSGDQYRVWLAGCTIDAALTLKPQTAADAAGNLGPAEEESGSGTGDNLAPKAQLTELTRSDKSISPSFELRFDELITNFSVASLSKSGTAKNCAFTVSEVTAGSVYQIDSSDCSSGSLRVSLLAFSVLDLHGNPGPVMQVDSPIVRITEPNQSGQFANRSNLNPLMPARPNSVRPTRPSAVKPNQKDEAQQVAATNSLSFESLKPESWVSVGIALVALAIAKRPRGRRAIRR